MRLLVVQYSGDYREAYRRLAAGEGETYYGHDYVLKELGRFHQTFGEVGVLCCLTTQRYREVLPSGVVAMGAASDPYRALDDVKEIMQDYNPTHVACLVPSPGLLRWSIDGQRRTISIIADSFERPGPRRRLRIRQLKSCLRHPRIEWVANHNVPASRSLVDLGVPPGKVIPWDWPHTREPDDWPPKVWPGGSRIDLLYVGSVTKPKGIGDAIRAVALLRRLGYEASLTVAGTGNMGNFRRLVTKLGVAGAVEFLGSVSNSVVTQMMRDAFAVLVPSRHSYPEGLPLTIYEALAARTPLIVSDHPMFREHLGDQKAALMFRAGHHEELAARVSELAHDPQLYSRLSVGGHATWRKLQVEVKWGDLIEKWLTDTPDSRAWLSRHSLGHAAAAQPDG